MIHMLKVVGLVGVVAVGFGLRRIWISIAETIDVYDEANDETKD